MSSFRGARVWADGDIKPRGMPFLVENATYSISTMNNS